MNKVFHYINGKEHVGSSDRFGDVFNPANGEKIREVNLANKDDVELAIECCLLYTSPSPRDATLSRMPSSA